MIALNVPVAYRVSGKKFLFCISSFIVYLVIEPKVQQSGLFDEIIFLATWYLQSAFLVLVSYFPFRYFLLRYHSFTKYFCNVRVQISFLPTSSCWIHTAISKKFLSTGTLSRRSKSFGEVLTIVLSQKYPVIFFLPKVSALINHSSPLPIQISIRSRLCPLSHESTIAPPLSAISPSPSSGK